MSDELDPTQSNILCWLSQNVDPIHREKCILKHDAKHTTVVKLIDNFNETVINFTMYDAL